MMNFLCWLALIGSFAVLQFCSFAVLQFFSMARILIQSLKRIHSDRTLDSHKASSKGNFVKKRKRNIRKKIIENQVKRLSSGSSRSPNGRFGVLKEFKIRTMAGFKVFHENKELSMTYVRSFH